MAVSMDEARQAVSKKYANPSNDQAMQMQKLLAEQQSTPARQIVNSPEERGSALAPELQPVPQQRNTQNSLNAYIDQVLQEGGMIDGPQQSQAPTPQPNPSAQGIPTPVANPGAPINPDAIDPQYDSTMIDPNAAGTPPIDPSAVNPQDDTDGSFENLMYALGIPAGIITAWKAGQFALSKINANAANSISPGNSVNDADTQSNTDVNKTNAPNAANSNQPKGITADNGMQFIPPPDITTLEDLTAPQAPPEQAIQGMIDGSKNAVPPQTQDPLQQMIQGSRNPVVKGAVRGAIK